MGLGDTGPVICLEDEGSTEEEGWLGSLLQQECEFWCSDDVSEYRFLVSSDWGAVQDLGSSSSFSSKSPVWLKCIFQISMS